jgi:hypothetical protein
LEELRKCSLKRFHGVDPAVEKWVLVRRGQKVTHEEDEGDEEDENEEDGDVEDEDKMEEVEPFRESSWY